MIGYMSVTEIAKRAGVSASTVSRVINSYPNVSPASVKRVTQAMERLGYEALPRGRGGRRSELDCVALLVSSHHMFDPYASTGYLFVRAVEQALSKRRLAMIVAYIAESNQLPEYVLRGKVRGAIVTGHNPTDELVDSLEHVPHVWLHSHRTRTGDVVLAGNEQIGRLAAEHLLGRGHRHLGAINILPEAAAKARVRYFRYMVEEAGRTCAAYTASQDLTKMWEVDLDMTWFEQQVAEQVDRMLADSPRPTGLLIPSDFQAAVAHAVLQQRGVKVGIDLELVSTDNEQGARMGLYPRPATIDLNPQAAGRRAVDHLMMRIANPDYENVQVVLKPTLIPGVSLRDDWSDTPAE